MPSPVVRVPHVLFLILITTLGGCCIKFPHSKEEESKASKVKQCAQPYTIVSGWSAQNCLALSPYSILSSAARVIFWKYKYSHMLPWDLVQIPCTVDETFSISPYSSYSSCTQLSAPQNVMNPFWAFAYTLPLAYNTFPLFTWLTLFHPSVSSFFL